MPSCPQAAIVAIGEELLRGEITDTNSAWLGAQLSALGYQVRMGLTVGDNQPDIISALQNATDRASLVLVTGGLGPTGDDLTVAAVAAFAGLDILESQLALENIAKRLRCSLEEISAARRRMAQIPDGARIFANPAGVAPGIGLAIKTCNIFLLPGVPHEMKAIFEESLVPVIRQLLPGPKQTSLRLLHLCGWSESKADVAARAALSKMLATGKIEIGTRLSRAGLSFRLTSQGARAEKLLEEASGILKAIFGPKLWGRNGESLAEKVVELLARHGRTLALAESCTGGGISSELVGVPGISAVLKQALVTYSNQAKIDLLAVPPELIAKHGAVSRQCATAMARGLRSSAQADINLSVTGIAGPDGGTPDKPVGTVHFSVAGPEDLIESEVHCFGGPRNWIRDRAIGHALWMIWRTAQRCFTE